MDNALVIIGSVVLAAACLYFAAVNYRGSVYVPIRRRLRGHVASGDVVGVVRHDNPDSATEYSLTVDFTTPAGTRYPKVKLADTVAREYAVGDQIDVVFDPDNPQDARVWSWADVIHTTVAFAPMCLTSAILLIVVIANGILTPPD
jgi:hypothetical protein